MFVLHLRKWLVNKPNPCLKKKIRCAVIILCKSWLYITNCRCLIPDLYSTKVININFLLTISCIIKRNSYENEEIWTTWENTLWSFIKFSQLILEGNVWGSVQRICMRISGLKHNDHFDTPFTLVSFAAVFRLVTQRSCQQVCH